MLLALTQKHHLYRVTILPPRYQALICKKQVPLDSQSESHDPPAIAILPPPARFASWYWICSTPKHAELIPRTQWRTVILLGPVHTYPESFKNEDVFPPFAFQLHLNGVFRYQKRRFSNFFPKIWSFFKTLAYRFIIRRVACKGCYHISIVSSAFSRSGRAKTIRIRCIDTNFS